MADPHRRRVEGRPEAPALGRYMELPSPTDRVAWALARRVEAGSPLPDGTRAAVTFHAGHAAWGVVLDGTRAVLLPGPLPRADAVVRADALTLARVLDGEESGMYAFLDGRLRIRGNMALALRLEGADDHRRPARFPRARTVRAGELETFYLEAGEGPVAVLLHGLGATNASMLPTIAELARDHRVLAPDLPGFGDSAKPVRAYHPAFYAGWLRDFLDAVGAGRAVLVGNSMGGRVALELALRAPDRVERLVLYAPSLAFRKFREATPLVRILAAELAAMPMVLPRALVTATLRSMFARPDRLPDAWYDAAVDEFQRIFATARGRMAFFSAARQIYLEEAEGEHGFWERIRGLTVPALFLWGERDQLVPAKFARHVEAALPGVASVVLADCGHVPQFEHPDRTHALVRGFLGPRA